MILARVRSTHMFQLLTILSATSRITIVTRSLDSDQPRPVALITAAQIACWGTSSANTATSTLAISSFRQNSKSAFGGTIMARDAGASETLPLTSVTEGFP